MTGLQNGEPRAVDALRPRGGQDPDARGRVLVLSAGLCDSSESGSAVLYPLLSCLLRAWEVRHSVYWTLGEWANGSDRVLFVTLVGWWEEMGDELKTKPRPF